MKYKIITLLIVLSIFSEFLVPSFANLKYAVHTSGKDIEYKKNKSLQWYKNNIETKKHVYYSVANDLDIQKKKSFNWYGNNIEKGKFYFLDPVKEMTTLKDKALRWYPRNSQ